MDKEFKTTFIPKKNLATPSQIGSAVRNRKATGLVGLIAVLLFITTAVSVIGVFLYKLRLETVVKDQIESINRAEKAFEPNTIVELKKLDIRLRAATELLENHVAVVDFFESFAETTLPDIQYSGIDIDFSQDVPTVTTDGLARGYLAIAQQSDILEENRYIQNPIFSDFSRTDVDRISFSLTFSINPELLVYGRSLQDIQPVPQEGQVEAIDTESAIIEDQSTVLPTGRDVEFNQ